ncbi:hypothetical protein KJ708_07110 [bacterium]|nr:hypothetical protein [bacterium]MBU1917144.1 hypothetical protein [bacterium]
MAQLLTMLPVLAPSMVHGGVCNRLTQLDPAGHTHGSGYVLDMHGVRQSVIPDVVTTPKGHVVARQAFAEVMSGALGSTQRPKASLSLPIPSEAPVTSIAPRPVVSKPCRAVNEFIDFMRPFASADIMSYLRELPADNSFDFFAALSQILFTHPQYHGLVDTMIHVVEIARYERNAASFAALRYSGLDVGYAQGERGQSLPETTIRHIEEEFLTEVKRKRGAAMPLIQNVYLRPHTVFVDYDKLHLIVGLTCYLHAPQHVFKAVQERIEESVRFLVHDIQARTDVYKEKLAGKIDRQRAVERVVGQVLYGLDMGYVRSVDDFQEQQIGLNIPELLKTSEINSEEKEIVIAEVMARLAAGLTSYHVDRGVIEKRLHKIP